MCRFRQFDLPVVEAYMKAPDGCVRVQALCHSGILEPNSLGAGREGGKPSAQGVSLGVLKEAARGAAAHMAVLWDNSLSKGGKLSIAAAERIG